jgi:hypothetical protein
MHTAPQVAIFRANPACAAASGGTRRRARNLTQSLEVVIMASRSGSSPGISPPPEQALELAFLPLHKRALGTAAAFVSAVLVFGATLIHMARATDEYPLSLLGQYLYGYSVTLEGALIGAFWAGIAGFVAGWFFAFCRNFALGVSTFIVRTRAELAETRDFLDHI